MFFLKNISSWSPRRVFLADAFGACLSSVILGVGLVRIKAYLGIEEWILYFLASLAILLFVYSFSVFLLKPKNWTFFMKVIALANLAYCPITWGLVIQAEASLWAYIYFVGETVLIASIGLTEWLYAKEYRHRSILSSMS